jgi:hypothetical protein
LGERPTPSKKNHGEKISKILGMVLINGRLCGYKERDLIVGRKGTKWGLGKIQTPFEEGQDQKGL